MPTVSDVRLCRFQPFDETLRTGIQQPRGHYCRLEILGSIRCNVKRGTLTSAKAAQALRLLRNDLKTGVYVIPLVDWPQVFKQAHRLSQRHSRPLLARSLDLLHVACALELGASDFLSFDERQSKAAKTERMQIVP